MSDKVTITIDCEKNEVVMERDLLEDITTRPNKQVKTKRAELIGMILLNKAKKYMGKSTKKLQEKQLKIFK